MNKKTVITEKMVLESVAAQVTTIPVTASTIITPLARDVAKEKSISFVLKSDLMDIGHTIHKINAVIVGADHRGKALADVLSNHLKTKGYEVVNLETSSMDYPEIAYELCQRVLARNDAIGLIIDGAGTGSAMACNKIKGIKAASCESEWTAKMAREHNHANVIALGAMNLGDARAIAIIDQFLSATPLTGKYADRVRKLDDIEYRFFK